MSGYVLLLLVVVLARGSDADNPCSQIIKDNEGEFQSPGYPSASPPNMTCNYKFSPNITSQPAWFYIHFDDLHLQPGDSIIIADKQGKFFFNETKEPFGVITSAFADVKFHTNASDTSALRRFKASYKFKDCSLSITDPRAVINAPLYNNNISLIINCTWHLTATPNEGVSLSFVSFNILNSYLLVYKGPTTATSIAGNYTGSILPPDTILPEMAQLVMVLTLYTATESQHFRAEMATISKDCSGLIEINSSQTILSPDLDIPQTEILDCRTLLVGPPNTTLVVQVTDLQLNNVRDALIINDGNGKYFPNIYASGIKKERYLLSRSNVLWVQFVNDLLVSKSSYKIDIQVQDVGGIVTGGKFVLPPSGKVLRREVIFQLQVPEGQQVETMIQFKNVMPYNEISFVDGDESVHYPLANFTKDSKLYPVFSMSNKMYVIAKNFNGSSSFEGGFQGVSKTGCQVISQETTGSFELTGNLTKACIWLIKPPISTGVIALVINKIKLGVNDTARIYKGLSNDKVSLIATFKADAPYQQMIYVPAQLGLRFEYSGNITEVENTPYLNAFYLILPECHTVLNLTNGDIRHLKSPGFPTQYPLNTNCTWYIRLPISKLLHITFNTLDLFPQHSLQISSFTNGTKQLISNISGQVYPDNLLINSSEVFIEWNPVPVGLTTVIAKGFDITTEVLDCGQNITAESGDLSTPSYPQLLNSSISCVWAVSVPISDGKTENSSNIELKIESTNSTLNFSSLTIHDGPSTTDPIIPSTNTTLLTRTHQVLITYHFHFRDQLAPAYKIHFTRKGCDVSHQCENGICMQKPWRCNGINDCGDFSDEFNCTAAPVPFVDKSGVPVVWTVVGIFIAFAIGFAIALAAPLILKRIGMIRESKNELNGRPECLEVGGTLDGLPKNFSE